MRTKWRGISAVHDLLDADAAVIRTPATRGIYVFSVAGQLLARYQLPGNEIAVNVVWGTGTDAGSLYIATLGVGKVHRLRR